ncbi:MAG: hypothetical protein ABL879_05925 [Devosia sp.]
MNLRTISMAAVAAFSISGAAAAADLGLDPIMTSPTSSYDWEGLYAGVNGGFWSGEFFIGGLIGNNFVFDNFLFGIEGSAELVSAPAVTGDVTGRAGIILDDLVLYANGGLGISSPGGVYAIMGVGAEFAVNDSSSVAVSLESTGPGIRFEGSYRFKL